MIDATFIERIQELGTPRIEEVNGLTYLISPRHEPKGIRPPVPAKIRFNTLDSIADFAMKIAEVPAGDSHYFLHVVDPTEVALYSELDEPWKRRPILAEAHAIPPGAEFSFDRYIDQETFVIHAQCAFADTEERSRLLQLVGTMRAGKTKTVADDGVSQKVTAASGVELVTEVELPNPITLRPFRTFGELEQPPARFILRARDRSEDQVPELGLWIVHDRQWELQAQEAIAAFLEARLTAASHPIPILY